MAPLDDDEGENEVDADEKRPIHADILNIMVYLAGDYSDVGSLPEFSSPT